MFVTLTLQADRSAFNPPPPSQLKVALKESTSVSKVQVVPARSFASIPTTLNFVDATPIFNCKYN